MNNIHARQGDLLFVYIGPPSGQVPLNSQTRLRASETTGHCHVIDGPGTVTELVGDPDQFDRAYVTLHEGCVIKHLDAKGNPAEHLPIEGLVGNYMVVTESDISEDGRTKPSPD